MHQVRAVAVFLGGLGGKAMHVFLIGLLVFGFMAIEAIRAAANERAQIARGGIEAPGDVYPVMQVAYPAAFLLMIGEALEASIARGGAGSFPLTLVTPFFIAGALLFVAAKTLKWWAITSLGRCWTFKVIVVPGSTLVASGPYRWLRHPNYVAVVGELVAVALMTGSRMAGPVATIGFSLLMLRRIAIEERALNAILRRG
jgi:methyltransferase